MGTTRLVSRRRQDYGAKWVRIAMAVLATAGLIDTGSITLKRWGLLGNLICPMGADGCDKVLNSAWGTVFAGIPLSMAGVLAYGAVFADGVCCPCWPGLQENKGDLSRRTWWGLFTVSLGMAVFSGVLLGVMLLKIQAFCFFCVLSAALSLALLVLSVVGGGWDDFGQLFIPRACFWPWRVAVGRLDLGVCSGSESARGRGRRTRHSTACHHREHVSFDRLG